MNELDTELYHSQTEMLGIEQVDFALKEPVFIRIQVINKGTKRKMPVGLVEKIAEVIREYDTKEIE